MHSKNQKEAAAPARREKTKAAEWIATGRPLKMGIKKPAGKAGFISMGEQSQLGKNVA